MKARTVQLGEVARIGAGQGAPQDRAAFTKEGRPFIRAASLEVLCGDGSDSTLERISEATAAKHRLRLYSPNTVVFAKSGMSATKNRIYRLRKPAYVVNHLATVEPGEELDATYLRYWLESLNPTRLIQDIAYPSISQEDIQAVSMSLPDLPEQQRIAGQLEQADRLRRTHRYALELSDTFLPAAFLQLFGEPAAISAGFPVETVGSLFSEERDGAKCGPFGSALKKHEYVPEGIPVWTMENVGENEFREEGCLYITPEKFEELKAYDAQNGDILISRAGTVGRMAIVETKHPRSIIHSNIIRLSLDPSRCLPIYFVVLMTFFAHRVGRLKRGQEDAYTFMNTGRLAELRIPVPPLPLQEQFALLVARHERLRAVQRESLRQSEHLFQSLLHHAFNTPP